MASTTSSIANLFSFFTTSKPPPPTKVSPPQLPHFSLSTNSLPSLSATSSKDALVPLVPSIDNNNPLPPPPPSSSYSSNELMSVVCPSLAYANTLFFRSAYNVQVIVDDNEPEDKLLNRFRREVMRAGVIQECKRRRYHETKQDEKKRKTREAAKRNRRRRPMARNFSQEKQETSRSKREGEEEDNWELPEGNLPY